MAWVKLGTASVTSTAVNTSWKELGRTTLGSAGDAINVTGLTAKDNMMVLTHIIHSGQIQNNMRFNNDSGNNYGNKYSNDGGSDSNFTSQANIVNSDTYTSDVFQLDNVINNNSSQEKLVIGGLVAENTSGAGNAPRRTEYAGKWANTSDSITQVNLINTGSGDFDTGSEVVVLGYDNDEADSGTNFWQELARVESSATDDTITTGTISAKKYLMVNFYASYTGDTNSVMVFNSDTGSNYSQRNSFSGGSDGTNTSQANFTFSDSSVKNWIKGRVFIVNKSDKEKLYIVEQMNGNDGAGNAPARAEFVGKWANTSDSITNITMNQSGSGSFTYKHLQVFGAD